MDGVNFMNKIFFKGNNKNEITLGRIRTFSELFKDLNVRNIVKKNKT